MPESRYHLAVIGAGSAGLSIANVAARLGLRVALIEHRRMGGECLNAGCVPSKALLAASHAARAARHAHRLGIVLPEPKTDWDAVWAHVHGAIAEIAPTDSEARYRSLGCDVLQDTARFVAPRTLEVAQRRIVARRIVVATGSRPAVPDIPGLADGPYLTNETLFDARLAPSHLLILGGGAIGLEMAQAHAGLGCRVTVVEAQAIAAREEPELADGLRQSLKADGVALLEHARVVRVEHGPSGPALVLAGGERIGGSHLLVSAGRQPNTGDLGLEAGNVLATARGIATDAGLRSTSNRAVFAAGDVADPAGIGPRQFTHVAGYHAGILVRRAIFRLPARLDYRALPRVTYTDPELAQTGMTEAEAREAGHAVEVVRWKLAANDRAIAEARTEGLAKLVTARGRVLGAAILAPYAGEMIGVFTLAIGRRFSASALASMIVPYPTRAEIGKRAAGELYAPRLFAPTPRLIARALAWLP